MLIKSLEKLLHNVQQLQDIMKNVASREALIQDVDEKYKKLYLEIEYEFEKLHKEGIKLKHDNQFSSLWNWCSYWRNNDLPSYVARKTYVDNLYNTLKPIELALCKCQKENSTSEELLDDLRNRFGTDFNKININLKSLMTNQNSQFIEEQILKCNKKIENKDYDGAITNARSLLEAILIELEKNFYDNPPKYDGDLIKLYKNVQKALKLDPARQDINQPLKQILSGLINIVSGLSSMRNKMSDAHPRTYNPSKHHAVLAVNAAKTLSNFILETFKYQLEKGTIKIKL